MGKSLVVRRGAELAERMRALRAAQYVRMSTDLQQYSLVNQAAAIAAYAQAHNLAIVRTYRDRGESGLQLKNRPGLLSLLRDLRHADFGHILVYDVSRWGRFQDVDESAHYEYLCRRAGVKISYCAEQFDNDGSLLSSIVKNLKRVMAAEYSRELSAKVHAGQCRLASLGFKQGGPANYGLSRTLIDENAQFKLHLKSGERKYLHTDRVKLQPGAPEEIETVRWIFDRFLTTRSETQIARELNQKGIPNNKGKPWNRMTVHWILQNEIYVGNLVFNRQSCHLKQKRVHNPQHKWVRCTNALKAIIDPNLFAQVQEKMKGRWVSLPREEMLVGLRRALHKHGRLTAKIINDTPGLPSSHTFMDYFGTLRKAYALIGHTPKRDYDWMDSQRHWSIVFSQITADVAATLKKSEARVDTNSAGDCFLINKSRGVSFRVARELTPKSEAHALRWAFNRRTYLPPGWIVVIRVMKDHRTVRDYLLFETGKVTERSVKFSDQSWQRYRWQRFETQQALVKAILRRARRWCNRSHRASHSPKRKKHRPMTVIC
ncbi:recombinase family protein [Bradyrhizobium sp. LjRoot220]|uniref:recombinase family protein n=1 Tax=Bradyrhizobium sp. LjRoot220 TaxID=3342284 RepID=UPI003ECD3191